MIPLDTTADIERLLSLNITGGWISEFRQVPIPIVEALYGRCGRFRALGVEKNKWQGVIAESNPPDEDSDWYIRMEIEKPQNWSVYKQPGGLDPAAENIENLRASYYDDLKVSNTPDWCDVHIDAKYGKSLSGQAVFRSSFRPEFHVTYNGLKTATGYPLMIGQDFGRTPAGLITQVDVRGPPPDPWRTDVDRHGPRAVSSDAAETSTSRVKFPGFPIFMVADPAGRQKSQVNEESPFDALKRLGFSAYAAPSNDIETRLRAVEQLFLRNVDGGPAVIIDGLACPLLVRALKFEYRYRRKQTGDLDDKPEKSPPRVGPCGLPSIRGTWCDGKLLRARSERQQAADVEAGGVAARLVLSYLRTPTKYRSQAIVSSSNLNELNSALKSNSFVKSASSRFR